MEIVNTLIGILIGSAITIFSTILWHWHTQRSDLYKRLLAFYRSRIESFKQVHGNLVDEFNEPALEVARAPLRSELLLIAPQHVLEIEQAMYECMYNREMSRSIKLIQFKQTGSQTSRRVNTGSRENMALDSEELKHASKIFDETYNEFVNTLRLEMGYWRTLANVFKKISDLKPPAQFGEMNPFYKMRERLLSDPESLEHIYRARIADEKSLSGAKPFELFAFTEMSIFAGKGGSTLALEFDPGTPGASIEDNKLVFGCLGYEVLFLFSQDLLEAAKRKISGYFDSVPNGKITLKKRGEEARRNWDDIVTVGKNKVSDLFQHLDTKAQEELNRLKESRQKETTVWKEKLKKAGRTIPTWQ